MSRCLICTEPGHRLAVVAEPVLVDAERREDEHLLLVDDLGEVGESPPVEGPGVHVDVDAALLVHLGPAAAHRPDDLLESGDVLVGEDRAHHLGPQVAGDVDERAVGHHLPDAPLGVGDLPGIEAGRAAYVAHLAAHHRLDGPGHPFAPALDRLDLDPEEYNDMGPNSNESGAEKSCQ